MAISFGNSTRWTLFYLISIYKTMLFLLLDKIKSLNPVIFWTKLQEYFLLAIQVSRPRWPFTVYISTAKYEIYLTTQQYQTIISIETQLNFEQNYKTTSVSAAGHLKIWLFFPGTFYRNSLSVWLYYSLHILLEISPI